MAETILAATNNAHKLRELRQILAGEGIGVVSADEVGGIPEVEEDRDTFEGNAVKKAVEVATATGRCVFADDSGLEVEALGGAPGVLSARYAGVGAPDSAKIAKLLGRLAGEENRRARFVCVIALASPNGLIGTARGEVQGKIIDSPRGSSGFGYDPVFVPDGHVQTFAELPEARKNSMSHRSEALRSAVRSGLFARIPDTPDCGEQRHGEA